MDQSPISQLCSLKLVTFCSFTGTIIFVATDAHTILIFFYHIFFFVRTIMILVVVKN